MIIYRQATVEDNQQLIELTASSGMDGEISLRIDRKPDFFKLLELRGESKTIIALNADTIIGSICVSKQQVYIDGKIMPLYYIGDFKVAQAFRNKGVGLRLCNELADYLNSLNADLVFLNFAKGNSKPVSFFKDRPNIPDFENIGDFNIHQFIGEKNKKIDPNYIIETSDITDEIIEFLNDHYRKYELANVITRKKLEGVTISIIRKDKLIIAALCLFDTMDIKQNIITRLSWKMNFLLKVANIAGGIAGTSKMPSLNNPVLMLYIKYLAVNNSDKHLVNLLVSHAKNEAFKKSYSFVSIGQHTKDPLNKCLSGMFKLTFNSTGMLLSIKNNKILIEKVMNGIPFEDFSLV